MQLIDDDTAALQILLERLKKSKKHPDDCHCGCDKDEDEEIIQPKKKNIVKVDRIK